jgi:ketosteroid isomerase-like protein
LKDLLIKLSTATYIDFVDASNFRWVEAANAEKGKRLMNLYGDDTFTKLMNKVKPYEGGDGGL